MRLVFILLFLTSFSFCVKKSKPIDCERFRTGKFFIILKPEGIRYDIDRYANTQTEYVGNTDTITGYTIKWTAPCEYELVKMYKRKKTIIDSSKVQRVIEFVNAPPLKVRITGSGKDYYLFESWKEGIDFIYKDTVWINKLAE